MASVLTVGEAGMHCPAATQMPLPNHSADRSANDLQSRALHTFLAMSSSLCSLLSLPTPSSPSS